jgi:hypothetical protein
VNPLDELTRALPTPPVSEELPRQQLHKTELLTIIAAASRRRRRALRNRVSRRLLVPALAAVAVAAVAVLAVTVPTLVGVGSGNPSASHSVRPGHSTGVTTAPSGAAPASPPTGSRLTRTWHWSVPAARFGGIAVSVNRGSVTIVTGSASAAAITATPLYGGQAPVLSSQVLDGTMALTARCPQEPNCRVALTLAVPAGVTVRATADLGDVRVTGLRGSVAATDRQGAIVLSDLSGRVSASNDLGDVTLTGLSGSVTASTAAGTISATDLRAAQVALASDEGSITAAFAAPPAHVTASSQLGSVVLRLPSTVTYDVIASTQLGRTSVTVPRSTRSPNVINASSRLGSVTVAGVLIKQTINVRL